MLNTKKKTKIQLSSNKLKTLKRFSIANIKSAPLKILIRTILVFLIIVVAYFSLNKYYIEASTYEINDTITGYFTDLNKKDFNHIQKYLYPDVGNRTYALAIGAKSVATGMQSIHLQRIYPALIDGEIGIVGFETTTKNFYQGQEVVLKETNTFIVKRFQGEWYITKPSDLRDYDSKYIESLIESYMEVIKKNISSPQDRILYNNDAFKKIIESKLK